MARETKPVINMQETFEKLDMRLGRILSVNEATGAPRASYRLEIDFGKFGRRTSVGRFTQHAPEELTGRLVVGLLNSEPRMIGDTESQALVLGVQFPKAESGEATPLTPLQDAKIGSKVF